MLAPSAATLKYCSTSGTVGAVGTMSGTHRLTTMSMFEGVPAVHNQRLHRGTNPSRAPPLHQPPVSLEATPPTQPRSWKPYEIQGEALSGAKEAEQIQAVQHIGETGTSDWPSQRGSFPKGRGRDEELPGSFLGAPVVADGSRGIECSGRLEVEAEGLPKEEDEGSQEEKKILPDTNLPLEGSKQLRKGSESGILIAETVRPRSSVLCSL